MCDDRLKLHIVVNDEVIDLRKQNFDKKAKNRLPYRTTSQQFISNPSARSGALGGVNRARQNARSDFDPTCSANGLRKLASNLSMMQRHKVVGREKLRNRATSADPRFRRERSPVMPAHAVITQSDSRVLEASSDSKNNKTQSDPTILINRQQQQQQQIQVQLQQQQTRKASLVRASTNSGSVSRSPRIESTKKIINNSSFPANSFVIENIDEILNSGASRKDGDKNSSLKCSASQNFSCGTTGPSIAEQSTMTEENAGTATLFDCKSLYQSAVTSLNFMPKNPDLEIYNSDENPCLEKPGQISPYWDDPRLIEKYSKVLKPIQIRKSKSSWTLPLVVNKQAVQTSCVKYCPKCTCITNNCIVESKDECTVWENSSDLSEPTITYEKTKTNIYNAMFQNYYLTAFFLVGSLCGLMLVALVVWILANDLLWTYMTRGPESQKYSGFRWLTAYIGGGILYGINCVFSTLHRMIVMPRNEAFDSTRSDKTWSIF